MGNAPGRRRFFATIPFPPVRSYHGMTIGSIVALAARDINPTSARKTFMIRPCTDSDFDTICAIVNEAAEAYRGVIPADRWHEPYMPQEELRHEIEAGVRFWGWEEDGEVVGVMGIQDVQDVTLIRHGYVRTTSRGQGIGGKLLCELRTLYFTRPSMRHSRIAGN
jgi:hypothetical protein